MDIHPDLYHPQLSARNLSLQNYTIFYCDNSFLTLIADVDVRRIMALIVAIVHKHQNAVKHANRWQSNDSF